MSTGSSGQTPVQTTQTSAPWSGAQPYLSQAMSGAQDYFTRGVGYQPWTGETQAPQDPMLNTAMTRIFDIGNANQFGTPGVTAAQALGTSLLGSGGLSAQQQGVIGQMQGGLGQFGNIYNRAGDVYAQNAGQQNPYLQAQIDAQNRIISDKVNSTMSGAGRYGSGAHTDVLSRSLAEAADPILLQDYQQRQNTMLQALQAQQAGAAGGQQTLGQIGNIYNQGQQSAGQWAQLMPTLDQAQLMPAQEIAQAGTYFQNRAQQSLADQINLYNAQQAYPWEELQRYNAILAGTGALGGTKITSATPYQAPLAQRLLGGAIAGGGLGSIFGPVGTGLGALGGGLFGAFG